MVVKGKWILSKRFVEETTEDGWYCDGWNLWLHVSGGGKWKSWVLIYDSPVPFTNKRGVVKNAGSTRYMGLGPAGRVSVDKARELAEEYGALLAVGKDPIQERDRKRAADKSEAKNDAVTVSACAKEFFDKKIAHKSHKYQYETARMLDIIHSTIGSRHPRSVDSAMIVDETGLGRLWDEQRPKGKRLRIALNGTFKVATSRCRLPLNPMDEDYIEALLTDKKYTPQPRLSLDDFHDVGVILKTIRQYEDRRPHMTGRMVSTYALEFVVLTAVRVSEVLKAKWQEIDRPNKNWDVPPEHRKKGDLTGKVRTIPITESMELILDEMERRRTDPSPDAPVFPSPTDGGCYDPASIIDILDTIREQFNRRGGPLTISKIHVHGFRNTLWSWGEAYHREDLLLIERQLDWLPEGFRRQYNAVARKSQIDPTMDPRAGAPRRRLMAQWDAFCNRPEPLPTEVIDFARYHRSAA